MVECGKLFYHQGTYWALLFSQPKRHYLVFTPIYLTIKMFNSINLTYNEHYQAKFLFLWLSKKKIKNTELMDTV